MYRKFENRIKLPTLLVCQAALFALAPANAAESPHDGTQQLFGSTENWQLVETYCTECHNSDDWFGQLSFDLVDREKVDADVELWEKVIRKLRSGMMPPPGSERPENVRVDNMVVWLE